MLHAQAVSSACGFEGEVHDASQIEGRIVMREVPPIGQGSGWIDDRDFAAQHAFPVAAKIEAMAGERAGVSSNEPLFDQVRWGGRTPDFLRRMGDLAVDGDGAQFRRCFVH